MAPKSFLADGNWYIWRAFSIAGDKDPLDGVARLFISMVARDAMLTRCKNLLIAFDGDSIFRYKLDEKYKVGRSEGKGEQTDNIMYSKSLPHLIKILDLLGFPWVQKPKLEGDDVLASTADCATGPIVIGTKDKDMYQVLRPGVEIYISDAKPKPKFVTHKDAERIKGVPCSKMVMYQTLLGDSIDSIPGIKGLGPKSVAKICMKYDSITDWYKDADKETRKMLIKHRDRINLNRKLVMLVRDQPEEPRMIPKDSPSRWDRSPNSLHDYVQFLYPKTKGLF